MNLREGLCHIGSDNPTDIKNDEQYKMHQICIILQESKVETLYFSNCGYVDCNQFLKTVSEKCQRHTYDYIFYEYVFTVMYHLYIFF
jgi:hypothetical protein